MSKAGEIRYLDALGEAGRRHASGKPFSDPNCDVAFARLGQVFSLLPQPPARVLDLGCGTGWTSAMLARRGFDVVGVDISPDMIEAAAATFSADDSSSLEFRQGDYELLGEDGTFDAVLFFDALHHAEDERAALACAHQALRPGGVCVVSEPGAGHHRRPASVDAVATFGVTEKEMPPHRVKALAREVGFSQARVFAHVGQLLPLVSGVRRADGLKGWFLRSSALSPLLVPLMLTVLKRWYGVVLLTR